MVNNCDNSDMISEISLANSRPLLEEIAVGITLDKTDDNFTTNNISAV